MTTTLALGDRVIVTHDLGHEPGTIVSISNQVLATEARRIHVQFADGTISSWGESFITTL